jgi:hypothetical protein
LPLLLALGQALAITCYFVNVNLSGKDFAKAERQTNSVSQKSERRLSRLYEILHFLRNYAKCRSHRCENALSAHPKNFVTALCAALYYSRAWEAMQALSHQENADAVTCVSFQTTCSVCVQLFPTKIAILRPPQEQQSLSYAVSVFGSACMP